MSWRASCVTRKWSGTSRRIVPRCAASTTTPVSGEPLVAALAWHVPELRHAAGRAGPEDLAAEDGGCENDRNGGAHSAGGAGHADRSAVRHFSGSDAAGDAYRHAIPGARNRAVRESFFGYR